MPIDSADIRPALASEALQLADRQCGLVTHAQLSDVGVDRWTIKRLRERGWLRLVHRGVYVVGHAAPQPWRREMAAMLACAPDSYVTHRDSLVCCGIVPERPGEPVNVTVIGRKCRSKPGITVHCSEAIERGDLGRRHGVPVTLPARALLESATTLTTEELVDAVDEAIATKQITRAALLRVTGRYPGHRGVRALREVADPNRISDFSRAQAQKRLTRLLNSAKAPPWRSEYVIGPYRPDFVWPELKLVVEVDGGVHRDEKRMEEDNARADWLRHRGWTVVRFSNRQVRDEPNRVLLRIGQELGRQMVCAPSAAAA